MSEEVKNWFIDLSYEEYVRLVEPEGIDEVRLRCQLDRFWLMENVLMATKWLKEQPDWKRRYMYEFVRNSEREPWGYIDLAARFHAKSLSITYAGTIQDILQNPELTHGIFSYKRALAKGFLNQIKRELEENAVLKDLFPDIFYDDPRRQSPKWSENEGLVVKRRGNPKECSVMAMGLIDSQLTGVHFHRLRLDDAIEKEAAGSQYMMEKAEEGIRLALGGLGTHDKKVSGAGTRWKIGDAYQNLEKAGLFKLRVTSPTEDGKRDGKPLYLTGEEWGQAKLDFSVYQFSCLMLNNPVADSAKNFKFEWLQWYDKLGDGWRKMNRYILVDPANEKKKDSDYTAMVVIGIAADNHYYLLDAVHDRLSLPERIDKLKQLYLKWKPKRIGYEKYGKDADIQAIKMVMEQDMLNPPIVEVGGRVSKQDRIEGLMPICQQSRLHLPKKLIYTDWEGLNKDVIDYFINWEYLAFPNGQHDDILDAMARINDVAIHASAPEGANGMDAYDKDYRRKEKREPEGTWLSA